LPPAPAWAEDYVAKVRGYLRDQVWRQPDFQEP